MVDRALIFSDPEIVKMLKDDFVPAAIDQWYQRRQKDAEGEFYRKIAKQGPRNDFKLTTQGRYVAAPDGTLLAFNNNRGSEKLKNLMKESLVQFATNDYDMAPLEIVNRDPMRHARPDQATTVIRINAKMLLDNKKKAQDWTAVFHDAISADNLWVLDDELPELVSTISKDGEIPVRIARRIARFHLVDNTRGEPPKLSLIHI